MKKTRFVRLALVSSVLLPLSVFAQSSRESLQKKLDYARWLKTRIESGQAPCQSESCKLQKAAHLNEAFQKSDMLPPRFRSTQARAFSAAYQMTDDPWIRPQEFFPDDLAAWQSWWERRFRNDGQRSSDWMTYSNEVLRSYAGLDAFVDRLSKASAADQKLLSDAFDRGALRIGFLLREVPLLMMQAEALRADGQTQQSENMRERALKLSVEREGLEKNFKGQFEGVIVKLFPRQSFKQAISALHVSHQWMEALGYSKAQDPALLKKLRYFRDLLKKINTDIQSYNDLEFGVVGLKNFHSTTNPLIATQQEAIIQSFLDIVDSLGRTVASIGTFYAAQAAMAGFTQSVFWRIVPIVTGSTAAVYWDVDWESQFWTTSDISGQLNSAIPRLEEEFEKRFEDLLKAYTTVCQRIESLEAELNSLQTNNQYREGVSL